jgi:hypothetical protein
VQGGRKSKDFTQRKQRNGGEKSEKAGVFIAETEMAPRKAGEILRCALDDDAQMIAGEASLA